MLIFEVFILFSNLLLWIYIWPVFLLVFPRFVKMYTSRKKIHKDKDAEPTEFEETVAQVSFFVRVEITILIHWLEIERVYDAFIYLQAIFDLENTNQELKSDLKDLYINSAL